jgi:hypothetical protein
MVSISTLHTVFLLEAESISLDEIKLSCTTVQHIAKSRSATVQIFDLECYARYFLYGFW